MKKPGRKIWLLLLSAVVAGGGCARQDAEAPERTAAGTGAAREWPSPEKLAAIVKAGAAPLWFEFSADGPAQISSPGDASLAPWLPWPEARFVLDILPQAGRLVMAVNREGFLVWLPAGDDRDGETAGLYRIDLCETWGGWTAGDFFALPLPQDAGRIEGAPAGPDLMVLLYRDDVFAGDDAGSPAAAGGNAPEQPLWMLPGGGFAARPAALPAINGSGMDAAAEPARYRAVKSFRRGNDGAWYGRAEWHSAAGRMETGYFRAGDPWIAGDRISFGLFRKAFALYNVWQMPEPFRLLAAAARDGAGSGAAIRLVLAADGAAELRTLSFSPDNGGGEGVELPGFYRQAADGGIAGALAFPRGGGFYLEAPAGEAGGNGGDREIKVLPLPPLPEGFVYTRIGIAGQRTLVAAWEEQQDYSVAAAGFMVMTVNEPIMYLGEGK